MFKNGINSTKTLLTSYQSPNTCSSPTNYNKQILDPLTVLIKICLLNYKDKGTKLRIYNNTISFQAPDLFQGTIRWRNGDNRYDLHNLRNPIERGVEWYIPKDNIHIRNIFETAMNGLKKLKESYQGVEDTNLVCDAISHYISILQDRLDKDISPDKIRLQSLNESNINKSLRNMWLDEEITIISNLLSLAKSKKYQFDITSIIKSIECLLEAKDHTAHEAILKYTTTL
jgi:hypothetical protein